MTTKWSIVKAAGHLHRDRHRAAAPTDDARSRKLLVWMDLVALREALHGELDAGLYEQLGNRIITAIADGKPVWPIYAAAKRAWRS